MKHGWSWGWGLSAMAFAAVLLIAHSAMAESEVPAATWELGRMNVDEGVRHVFQVADEEGTAWKMEEVGVSCDCIEVEGWTPDVPADGTGEISMHYHPAGTGFVEEWVNVRGHDSQGREVIRRYRVTGRVMPAWGIDPGLCPDEGACRAILDDPLSVLVVDVRGVEAF